MSGAHDEVAVPAAASDGVLGGEDVGVDTRHLGVELVALVEHRRRVCERGKQQVDSCPVAGSEAKQAGEPTVAAMTWHVRQHLLMPG